MKEINYMELLSKEVQNQILDLRARGVTVKKIAYQTEITKYVIEKFLLQVGESIPDLRYKENIKPKLKEMLKSLPFSTEELDYGYNEEHFSDINTNVDVKYVPDSWIKIEVINKQIVLTLQSKMNYQKNYN